ncbi:alpha/beta hydrolase [Streptomyces sp. CA-278952]|uniref:alpha/beta hydrolase n=1 Tax=Streptomyces sp. CA-278952 TaxID=2980556 RepID=UPI003FA6D46A
MVLVGHSYGGAVITEAGDLPNVTGLVYIAAFAPDAGESPGQISQEKPPAAFENLAPDSDGYLWIKQDKFHRVEASAITAVWSETARGRCLGSPGAGSRGGRCACCRARPNSPPRTAWPAWRDGGREVGTVDGTESARCRPVRV